MTRPNTSDVDPKDNARDELRNYAIGFGLSLVLTVAAFAAVLSDLSDGLKIVAVCVAGFLQIATHLIRFLHLSFSGRQSREDLLLVLFSTTLLAIMVGGTVVILADLRGRMHGIDPPAHKRAIESAGQSKAH